MNFSRLLVVFLVVAMIFVSFGIQPTQVIGATAEDIIISPADGHVVYCGETLVFSAEVPFNASAVGFDLDGVDMGSPIKSGYFYSLKYDVSELENCAHTFTVNVLVEDTVIEKSSTFNLYCDEFTILENNFDIAGDALNEDTVAACENDVNPAIWSFGGTVALASDGTGNKWFKFSASNVDYPEIRIGLNNKFFGYNKIGLNAGLSEGVVTTEFDIKMNSKSGLSLNGSGAPGMTSSSYYGSTGVWRIFNPDGTLGNSSIPYTYGADAQWGHVRVVTDYTSNSWSYFYNDSLVYTTTGTLSAYGIANQWDMYGLKIQAYGNDVDYEIDNFQITHGEGTHMGYADFNNFTVPSGKSLDAAFAPRGYVPAFDMTNTSVSVTDGACGGNDKALYIVPNGDTNPNYRFYFQNKPYKGATTGVLKAEFDIKLDAMFDVRTGSGFGFDWIYLFSSGGKAGNYTYETGKWYHMEIVADYDEKTAHIYIDGKLHSTVNITGSFLPSEYLHLLVYGNSAAGSNGVAIDNLHFDYITPLTLTSDTSAILSVDTVIPLTFNKAFTKITASDVSVSINGKNAEIASVSTNDKTVNINLANPIGQKSNVTVIVGTGATVHSITPMANSWSVSFEVGMDVGFDPISVSHRGNVVKAEVNGKLETSIHTYNLYLASYKTENGTPVLDSINIKEIVPVPGIKETWSVSLDSIGAKANMARAFLWRNDMNPIDEKTISIMSADVSSNIGETILTDVGKYCGTGNHPRIMLTNTDFSRITTIDDAGYKTGITNVCAAADKLIAKDASGNYTTPPLAYEIADGIRLLPVSRGVLSRVTDLAMAYRLTNNDAYAARAYAELESAAKFPDWNPKHFLDVGEMCNAFAIGYDWLYDWMDDSQKSLLRSAIVTHGLNPAMDDYLDNERIRTYKWYQDDPGDNWKFVCNGGVSNAVLAICDEPDVDKKLCSDILGYAFHDIYNAVRNLYLEDGSYAEGFTYWTYASNYLGYYTSALCSATGTDYGLTMYEPLKESAYYIKNISSNRFISFNFGDAAEVNLANEIFLWYGDVFSAPDLAGIRASRFGQSVGSMDLLWYNHNEYTSGANGSLTYGRVGGTEAAFRSGWTNSDLYGAIHFGANNVAHAHSDTGTFVIEYGGKRFFNDIGQDNYNVSDYTKTYRYRTEGHNTISLRSKIFSSWDNQSKTSACYIDTYNAETDKNNYVISDMSAAYDGKGVVRGMMMTADKKAIIVQDKLTPNSLHEGYWFAHTKASISLSADKRGALLNIDGVKLWAQIISDGHTFSIMNAEHLDSSIVPADQYDNSAFKKLAIKFTGNNEISVAFIPLSSGENAPSSIPAFTTITSW